MEQISKILRILLKRMPYQPFINGELNCLSMNKNKLAEVLVTEIVEHYHK